MLLYINRAEVVLMLRIRCLTQKEFAKQTGLSEVYISRLLTKQSSVGIEAQRKIQRALGLKSDKDFLRLFVTVDK